MKTEINSGMKTTEMLTCGIFYCRDSAEINDCGSLQTSSRFDSDLPCIQQLTIPPLYTQISKHHSNKRNHRKPKVEAQSKF